MQKRFGVYVSTLILALSFQTASAQNPVVQVEEDVYSFKSPNNGSGPLWSFGCTSIVRTVDDVYVSQMETGDGVEPLCNTRWRLLRRDEGAWTTVAMADRFRQREPCSLALTDDSTLNLYVNDSRAEPGTHYQECFPHVLRFSLAGPAPAMSTIIPNWGQATTYTDHSYRGYASDSNTGSLLMLNIDAATSKQHYALIDRDGVTQANGAIEFPIRAAYPQVALAGNAVHVLAVGDIVEPNETWRTYKAEQTGRSWDYVFRRLFYVVAPDLKTEGFSEPIEIANRDSTAGHIRNQDLAIGSDGAAYLLYTARETQSALMRDKFFPDLSLVDSLHLVVVRHGEIVDRRVIVAGTESSQPTNARFHKTPDGDLLVLIHLSGDEGGNKLVRLSPSEESTPILDVSFDPPFTSFMLATERAGNKPSNTIDVLGHRGRGDTLSYGRITLKND